MMQPDSYGRLPLGRGWSINVRRPDGTIDYDGWEMVEIRREGAVVAHPVTGIEQTIAWADAQALNADFSLDAFIEAFTAPDQREAVPQGTTAQMVAIALWLRLLDREVAVRRSNGDIERTGWRIVDFDDTDVKVNNDRLDAHKWISWGDLLRNNEALLPIGSSVRREDGSRALFRGVVDGMATYECFASFLPVHVKARDFYPQVQAEDLDRFAFRNRHFFGLAPPAC